MHMIRKSISLIWCALSLLLSTSAIAQDRITASLLPTQANGEWTLELNLENPNESRYTALQLDITLPAGFTIATNSAAPSTRLPDHSLAVSAVGSSYRVVAYSLTNAAIVGNSGSIASMTLLADATVETGTYSGALSNIMVSNRAGEEVEMRDYAFSWNYEKVSSSYTITYWVDGKEFTTQEYKEGESIIPTDAPEKEGHTFAGWQDLPECMPGEDINVEAIYTVNSYLLTFRIDSIVVKQDSVAYGTIIAAPEVEEREGHTFTGWTALPETMPAADVEVTGAYAVNSYLLTFRIDGTVVKQDSVAYGAIIVAPEVEEREGHTFTGWTAFPETMPAADVEVTGAYAVNTYKITYILDGEVYAEDSVTYGAVIVPLQVEEDETFTFSGWSNLPEVMPASDIIVTGTTTPTAIHALHATDESADVYTLSGKLVARKVATAWIKTALPKGVYIINGQKVVVK